MEKFFKLIDGLKKMEPVMALDLIKCCHLRDLKLPKNERKIDDSQCFFPSLMLKLVNQYHVLLD